MSDGETASASARLSNPSLDPSAGSSVLHVDVECQQIADGVGVLGAVQTMQRRGLQTGARIDCDDRDALRSPTAKPSRRRPFGPRRAAWRHHARADLLDDFFPGLRVGSDVGDVERVERQSSDLGALVVAGDAVLVDECRFGRCRLSRRRPVAAARSAAQRRRTGSPARPPMSRPPAARPHHTDRVAVSHGLTGSRCQLLDQLDRRWPWAARDAWPGTRLPPRSAASGLRRP